MVLTMSWGLTALAATALLALFLFALERRWLAGYRRGFLITLMLALGGIGVTSSILLGAWGFNSAERLLSAQAVQHLGNIEGIIESEVSGSLDQAMTSLDAIADASKRGLSSGDASLIRQSLRDLQHANPSFLQFNLIDRHGNSVLTVDPSAKSEAIGRVAIAYGLEGVRFASDPHYSAALGRYVLTIGVPVKSTSGEVAGFLASSFDIQGVLTRIVASTRFGETGYSAIVGQDGLMLAHPNPQRLRDNVSQYPAVRAALRGEEGSAVAVNNEGKEMLYVYRALDGTATVNPKPMVLMTEMQQSEASAALVTLRRQFIFGAAVFTALCLLVAWWIAHSLRKPLSSLLNEVNLIDSGELTARIADPGRDEFGQLSVSLNRMAKGLEEKEFIKEVFGRYVTKQVSEEVMRGDVNLGGESRCVTILFSDIRSFTALAEQMAPTEVVAFLNDYFSEMVEAVFEQSGILDKFIGDGMMAVFGSLGKTSDHPRRAVMAALRMKALLGKINGERAMKGLAPISIGIGIHTDEVVVGNIGSRKRLEYTVIGDGVNTSSRVQALNKEFGTTILITGATYEAVRGEFECRPMPEVPLRGKSQRLAVFEVLSLKS
ncbi:MAG: HAMP domain-containing protein [Gemmatimonadales bacterium]|nr:HAMP domain-containing protein [Gemmatimonadales bacterium]NIN12350.1 HAMP domain-containing protein [Gemmatimonadales bacterium]NIN48888.1 HAMP domain-containing protein [Gemmatimonadales bacterium]NIP06352.1 HAMP domain-containing protein [Gemmatimonadales bacterium]NIR00725.1 HAMP domain-containing protein [Gemmatimonadales bacterium]